MKFYVLIIVWAICYNVGAQNIEYIYENGNRTIRQVSTKSNIIEEIEGVEALGNIDRESNLAIQQTTRLNAEISFNIYPNPVSRSITIETIKSNKTESFAKCEIYNSTGKLLSTSSADLNSIHFLFVDHLSSGIYVLKITYLENITEWSFVKQN